MFKPNCTPTHTQVRKGDVFCDGTWNDEGLWIQSSLPQIVNHICEACDDGYGLTVGAKDRTGFGTVTCGKSVLSSLNGGKRIGVKSGRVFCPFSKSFSFYLSNCCVPFPLDRLVCSQLRVCFPTTAVVRCVFCQIKYIYQIKLLLFFLPSIAELPNY